MYLPLNDQSTLVWFAYKFRNNFWEKETQRDAFITIKSYKNQLLGAFNPLRNYP
jgi:hypothetical protein